MKYIKSEKITKRKYLLTLEVSDYDLEMFEDFATTYAPHEVIEEASPKNNWNATYSPDFKKKYRNWMSKVWSTFWKCWHVKIKFKEVMGSNSWKYMS